MFAGFFGFQAACGFFGRFAHLLAAAGAQGNNQLGLAVQKFGVFPAEFAKKHILPARAHGGNGVIQLGRMRLQKFGDACGLAEQVVAVVPVVLT